MLFADLSATSDRVAATAGRSAKRDALATAIAAAGGDEIGLAVGYLSGSLRQRRTNIGWASLPAVDPAESAVLSVADVDTAFEQIAAQSGAGSAGRRAELVTGLLGLATESEQRLLRGLVVGEVRQGALDSLVQDALAAAFGVPVVEVRRAAMLVGSTAEAAVRLASGGLPALQQVALRVGQPVRPMLAAAAADVATAVTKSGLPAIVDAKLDGIRVQVHRDGSRISVFTRSLDEITDRVPELVAAVASLPVTDIVLDGEAIAMDAGGRPRPFQVTAARAAERPSPDRAPSAASTGVALSLFCFDMLQIDGRDLLDLPLSARVAAMHEHLPEHLVVPRILAASPEQVSAFFDEAVGRGFEGVVVKRLDAGYAAGRRDSGWIKLKPRHTFDLAVTAAEWGYGRRTGFLSNLHLAARDPETGGWVMLGKTFKGLTDRMLAWQTAEIRARESGRTASTVYADPPLVAEIACDGLQASSRYPGGVALRFARVVRYRADKTPDEVDTIDTVRALAPRASGTPASLGTPAGQVGGAHPDAVREGGHDRHGRGHGSAIPKVP